MRYLFRGLIRETGRPVEGHVEANTEGDACHALSENGVVTESLIPDPKPLNLADELPKAPEFADALESAFDSSSSQVDFDALTERYHGKKVWVIDRDKIRRRVAQVIDAALALSALHGETHDRTRARINTALEGMFADNTQSRHRAQCRQHRRCSLQWRARPTATALAPGAMPGSPVTPMATANGFNGGAYTAMGMARTGTVTPVIPVWKARSVGSPTWSSRPRPRSQQSPPPHVAVAAEVVVVDLAADSPPRVVKVKSRIPCCWKFSRAILNLVRTMQDPAPGSGPAVS